jgi:oligopeptide transport system permease protein
MITPEPSDFIKAQSKEGVQKIARPSLSYWGDAWIRLKKNKQAIAALYLLTFLVAFTLAGPLMWRVDPSAQNSTLRSQAPSFRQKVLVLDESPAYEPIRVNAPNPPTAVDPKSLEAPAEFSLASPATRQAVRLKWRVVPGAVSYAIYRSNMKPASREKLGVPLWEVEGAGNIDYEDKFNLEAGKYFYSIVAKNKNRDEAEKFSTLDVEIKPSIKLKDARLINPDAQPGQMIELPSHPMGTDDLGRDMLARLMAGARISLFIGFFAPLLYVFVGMLIGGFSGFVGGTIDQWIMRVNDFVQALPFLLFMILIKVALGLGAGDSGIMPMMVSLVILSWPTSARMVRGQVLQLRESEFVQAAKLLGAKPWYLISRHLLSNTMGVILVDVTSAIPFAIFTEAFLSFIGMGVVPPTPSWGSMCNDGFGSLKEHPYEFLFPAIMISLTVLTFNLLGDGLRDALDPRLRSTE